MTRAAHVFNRSNAISKVSHLFLKRLRSPKIVVSIFNLHPGTAYKPAIGPENCCTIPFYTLLIDLLPILSSSISHNVLSVSFLRSPLFCSSARTACRSMPNTSLESRKPYADLLQASSRFDPLRHRTIGCSSFRDWWNVWSPKWNPIWVSDGW